MWINNFWLKRDGRTRATPLDPKQIVSSKELLMPQVLQQEALPRLLVEKGIFTKEAFLKMMRVVDREMKTKRRS